MFKPFREVLIMQCDDLSQKARLKLLDSIIHNVDESNERINNRLTLDNLRLVERYLADELTIQLCWRFQGESEKWNADFRNGQGAIVGRNVKCKVSNGSNIIGGGGSVFERGDGKLHVLDSGICYYEQPVFILDVELMKLPQPSVIIIGIDNLF